MANTYATNPVSKQLLAELVEVLQSIGPYGSVEIYVQDNTVTQITTRNIKKTKQNGIVKKTVT